MSDVRAHAVELARGYNHPKNAELMGHLEPLSAKDVVLHYQALLDEGAQPFLLYLGRDLVGDADIRGVRDGAAEFAFMIAAPEQQGKGLGTKFALMVHAYAFATLGLTRVYASIVAQNHASRRVFEKLGYQLDNAPEARSFADDTEDVTLRLDRASFEQRNAAELAQLRFTPS